MNRSKANTWIALLAVVAVLVGSSFPTAAAWGAAAPSAKGDDKPEFPPLEKVLEGYDKVISTADGKSLYTVWTREKDAQMLAALPPDYANRRFFIALTISSGEDYAGLQAGSMYVYWRRYDDRLALVAPNIEIKSTGDDESKSSVQRLFTDRIILDVPIVTISQDSRIVEKGCPVIDMDAMLIGQCDKFFGNRVRVSNAKLAKIAKAKAFPENIELAFEIPSASGRLQILHYSISAIPQSTGYKPRKADSRVGYFTTTFSDYGQFKEPETKVRYINRWNLEKADPSLQVSPPKNPIVFYIEHTTPVRYRRWVRQGLLYWNEAFEKVGISNAVEVYYQDKKSGAHMEKDPEDVRYNFIRWNTNAIEVGGDDKVMSGVRIKNNKSGEEETIAAKGLFYAIGHLPNTAFLNGQLETDETGYVITEGGTTITSIPGVFAAGDVQDKKYRQAVTAAGSGCMAALEAEDYLTD